MAQPYLNTLEMMVVQYLPATDALQCKHFFSGAALYVDTRICLSLTPAGLAFKLPEEVCEKLVKSANFSPLQYFANSPVKKGYVLAKNPGCVHGRTVAKYMREAVAYARQAQS